MATQTKADRSAAGKKAAATRERNQKREESKDAGPQGRCDPSRHQTRATA